jgi:hypothetical protein
MPPKSLTVRHFGAKQLLVVAKHQMITLLQMKDGACTRCVAHHPL